MLSLLSDLIRDVSGSAPHSSFRKLTCLIQHVLLPSQSYNAISHLILSFLSFLSSRSFFGSSDSLLYDFGEIFCVSAVIVLKLNL